MVRWLALLGCLQAGCAGLLGIDDLAGEIDSAAAVAVLVDRLPAEGVDVIGHRIDGSVADHQVTDSAGEATIAIPGGGLVSVLIEISPGQLELRTWADVRDGDRLVVNAVADNPTIPVAVTLSDENTGGLNAWRVSFRTFSRIGFGGLGAPLADLPAIGRDNVGDGRSISAIARLRSGGAAMATATVTDAPLAASGPTELSFSSWSSADAAIAITADLGIEGDLVVGEVRGGQFFVGEDFDLDAGEALNESVVVDAQFADVIGVAVIDDDGAPLQTEYVEPGAGAHTVELAALAELISAVAELEPRPAITWTVEPGGDTDSVLAVLELVAAEAVMTWRVEADPRRGQVLLPSFPDGLPVDPASFDGLEAGQVRAFASSAHDGYRALRTAGVSLAGHMASEAPILDVPGTVRAQSLELGP